MPTRKRPQVTDKEEYLLDVLHHIEGVAHSAGDAVGLKQPLGPGVFGKIGCKVLPPAIPPPFGRWCFVPPGIGPRPFAKGCLRIGDMGQVAEGGVLGAKPRRKAPRTRKQVKR